jgi:uncharacterized membrane protein YfcA
VAALRAAPACASGRRCHRRRQTAFPPSLEYLAFILWCFAVALSGGLVGLVLGNLRLPATLLIAGSPAAGTGANLVISAAAAGAASIAHIRAGRVNWRLFAWMAPPSIAGALLGGYISGAMPKRALLAAIAAVLAYSAAQLLHGAAPRGVGPRHKDDGAARGRTPAFNRGAAVVSGAVIGVLGGIVGLILGSLRMPALLRFVGEAPARAAGTNVTVGLCVGIAGALGHLPSHAPDWKVAAVGAGASIPAALLGSRLTGRLSEAQLIRAIGWVLVVAAIATGVEALA